MTGDVDHTATQDPTALHAARSASPPTAAAAAALPHSPLSAPSPLSPPPPSSNSRKRTRTPAASADATAQTQPIDASGIAIDATDDDAAATMSESNDYYGSMQLRELLPQSQRSASDLEGAKLRARRATRRPMFRTLVVCGAALSLLLLTSLIYFRNGATTTPLHPSADDSTATAVANDAAAAAAAASRSRDELLQTLLRDLEAFSVPVERVSSNGALRTTLHVESMRYTNGPIAFNTRAYDGQVPGPTLRLKPGDTLEIDLINDLAPNVPGTWTLNTYHSPNTTNLHFHGMHVDPNGIADNVSRVVGPGERATTVVHIPRDHPRGLFHYHPHYHGSVFAQMGGGMAGALFVDDADDDDVPEAYRALPEHVMVLQEFRFNGGLGSSAVAVAKASRSRLPLALAYTRKSELDELVTELYPRVHQVQGALDIPMDDALRAKYPEGESSGPPITDYFTVNGQYLPKLTVRPRENHLLRLVNAGGVCTLELSVPGCTMTLTASDGIYLSAPRVIETLILSNGARADVVLQCAPNSDTLEPLRPIQSVQLDANDAFLGVSTDVFAGVVAFVHVTGSPRNDALVRAIPKPSALYDARASLLDLSPADRAAMDPVPFKFAFSMGGTTQRDGFTYKNYYINGKEFDGTSMRTMPLGVVQEWVVENAHLADGAPARANHPFHMHTNAFQVVAMSHGDGVEYKVGDWRDVISVPTPGNVTIRFRPVDFTGVVVAHCHVLGHSDGGMVAAVTITP